MSHIHSHRYMFASVYHKASALARWDISFLSFFLFNGLVQSREFTFYHILRSSVDNFFFETLLCSPGWSWTQCIGGWLNSWSPCLYLLTAGITDTPCLIYSVMGLEPRASWVLSASDLPVWSSWKFLRDNTLLVGCLVSFSLRWTKEYQETSGVISTDLSRSTEAQRQHCLAV